MSYDHEQADAQSWDPLWDPTTKDLTPETGAKVREFESGATRDTDDGKPSYASYLSPLVIERYGRYMLRHEVQSDGTRREPGNWKKGMPVDAYRESLFRHYLDAWLHDDGFGDLAREDLEEALCAIIFNASGWLDTVLKRT